MAAALQEGREGSATVFLGAIEVKGSSTTDKLAAPETSPAEVSKGYPYKAPGADRGAPAH